MSMPPPDPSGARPPATGDYSFATLEKHVGRVFGPSAPMLVDQGRIDLFARATDDHQWIHTDPARAAREGPFGGTIAHGYLTLSLIAASVEALGVIPADAGAVINYGLEKVRFLAPVPAGAMLVGQFTLAAVEGRGPGRKLLRLDGALTCEGAEKPALTGQFLALVLG